MFSVRPALRRTLHTLYGTRPSSTLASWRASAPTLTIHETDWVSLSRIRGLVSTLELPPDGLADAWSTGYLVVLPTTPHSPPPLTLPTQSAPTARVLAAPVPTNFYAALRVEHGWDGARGRVPSAWRTGEDVGRGRV